MTTAMSPEEPSPTIAIVGSGPAGCYAGLALAKAFPAAEISVFEALPAPYGLLRYGVAADHQGTKLVARQFDRLFTKSGARFIGNVTIGMDVSFEALAEAFDVVILATGLPVDKALDIPLHPHAEVVGAGALLRALNGFPGDHGESCATPPLGRDVVVVGMGNVAIDVARLLAKPIAGFHGSDIDDAVLERVRPAPPRHIDLVGRSSASAAKFDLAMLRELAEIPGITLAACGLVADDQSDVAAFLRERRSSARVSSAEDSRITLWFNTTPERVEMERGRQVVHARRAEPGAAPVVLRADTVVTAVGFTDGLEQDKASTVQAWSGPHVFRVGWLGAGARGAIAENRKHAQSVVATIVQAVRSGLLPQRRPGYSAIERSIVKPVVSFEGWQQIDSFEVQSAAPGRARKKVTSVSQMLAIARGDVVGSDFSQPVDRFPMHQPQTRTVTSVERREK